MKKEDKNAMKKILKRGGIGDIKKRWTEVDVKITLGRFFGDDSAKISIKNTSVGALRMLALELKNALVRHDRERKKLWHPVTEAYCALLKELHEKLEQEAAYQLYGEEDTTKKNKYDDEGHLMNMEVWDWIVTKDGTVRQITHDDMPDLKASQIARYATEEEIKKAKSDDK